MILTRAVNKILKNEKKELILKASLETFSRIGFAKATMRKIAENAGIAVGTIYIYFKNKDEILQELLDRYDEEHKKLFEKMAALSAEKAIRLFYEERFSVLSRVHNLTNLFIFEATQDKRFARVLHRKTFEKVNERMLDFLKKSMDKGEIRKFKNPEALSVLMLGMISSVVSWKESLFPRQLKELGYERITDAISELLRGGLLT